MIELNEDYWDCECEEDYIHEKAKKKYCVKCNTLHFNQPDSRQNEVDILLEINDSQNKIMKTQSVDVICNAFVNVTFPADWNAEDEAVYERIRQVAIRKYKERIDIGDIDFDIEPYEDHDPTDKSEV